MAKPSGSLPTIIYWPALLIIAAGLASCEPPPGESAALPAYEYSFFVAGHAYGTPDAPVKGLYPPLIRMASALNSDKSVELGVLPGDITRNGTTAEWDVVDRQLKQFEMPVHKVMGNHDARDRSVWSKRYGPAYYSLTHRDDLFIVLDTNNSEWNVDAQQLAFLTATLTTDGQTARNIFVFCHQLIWASADSPYADLEINAEPQRPAKNNFWNQVLPLLQSSAKPTYLFAGDMGAWAEKANYMYTQHGNVRLIGTGMGDTIDDDLIIVHVPENSAPRIELLNLQTGDLLNTEPRQAF